MATNQKPPKPRVYCDACFFIAIFNNEANRAEICSAIVEDAKQGLIEIYSSVATILECCKPPDGPNFTTEQVEEFLSNDYFERVEVDRIIAFDGRSIQQIVRNTGRKLKPFDGLHLATALREKCTHFFTYDRQHIIRLNDPPNPLFPGIVITEPCRPWHSGQKSIFEMFADATGEADASKETT